MSPTGEYQTEINCLNGSTSNTHVGSDHLEIRSPERYNATHSSRSSPVQENTELKKCIILKPASSINTPKTGLKFTVIKSFASSGRWNNRRFSSSNSLETGPIAQKIPIDLQKMIVDVIHPKTSDPNVPPSAVETDRTAVTYELKKMPPSVQNAIGAIIKPKTTSAHPIEITYTNSQFRKNFTSNTHYQMINTQTETQSTVTMPMHLESTTNHIDNTFIESGQFTSVNSSPKVININTPSKSRPIIDSPTKPWKPFPTITGTKVITNVVHLTKPRVPPAVFGRRNIPCQPNLTSSNTFFKAVQATRIINNSLATALDGKSNWNKFRTLPLPSEKENLLCSKTVSDVPLNSIVENTTSVVDNILPTINVPAQNISKTEIPGTIKSNELLFEVSSENGNAIEEKNENTLSGIEGNNETDGCLSQQELTPIQELKPVVNIGVPECKKEIEGENLVEVKGVSFIKAQEVVVKKDEEDSNCKEMAQCGDKLSVNAIKGEKEPVVLEIITPMDQDNDVAEALQSSEEGNKDKKQDKEMMPCVLCNKVVQGKFNLKLHIKTHAREHAHTCIICSRSFRQASTLKNHHTRIHTIREKKYKCNDCDQSFSQWCLFKEHKEAEHPGEEKHQCHICEKVFPNKTALKAHVQRHTDPRRYQCQYCQKVYKDRAGLNVHLVIHTQVSKFCCVLCNRKFGKKNLLTDHMKIFHLKQKDHVCDVCHRAFSTKNTLKRHNWIHTGEKNYICELCGRPFRQKVALTVHMKVHNKPPKNTNIITNCDRVLMPLCKNEMDTVSDVGIVKVENEPVEVKFTPTEGDTL